MKRFILASLLTLGVIGGLCSGFHSLHHHQEHRAAFERHVAELCVDAAERSHHHEHRK
ncbi:MAG TPA: hypothetical protein VLC09_06605 [Polyangiaceae bacterium]|nr:hypothetical protein [Polyangiaceae bacterium]